MKRKIVFGLLTLLLVYGVVELISLLAYSVVAGAAFSFSQVQDHRAAVMQAPDRALASDTLGPNSIRFRNLHEVIHPYIGYVADPVEGEGVNAYGFLGEPPRFNHAIASRDTVVVAVLGGSVAGGLLRARQTLRRVLGEARPFAGKEIVLVNLALGGMKQPQQLMVMNYFMSLGAHFDLVINLDGFNEIVLPVVENNRTSTFPFYPRMWKPRVAGLGDPDLLRLAGRIALLEDVRHQTARFFSRGPLNYSVTANVFWYLIDHALVQNMARKQAVFMLEMVDQQRLTDRKRYSYAATGPSRTYASEEAFYTDLVAYWKRSSVLLNNLARGNGFHYFHFLQPNQYVFGSKIFSEEERAIALPEKHPYKQAATVGYPYLMEKGKDLVAEGVAYTDLTMIFAGNDEILYQDGCCHLNLHGNELMALAIGRVIRDALEEQ